MSNSEEENKEALTNANQNWLDEPFVPSDQCKTVVATKQRDFQAEHMKGLVDDAFRELVQSQSHMEIIHNPRNYTRHQNNLMKVLTGYVWGAGRIDVVNAANEITENISILEEVAPSDLSALPSESCEALRKYTEVKVGCLENVRQQAKGYELLATWIDAIHVYAKHTGQLDAEGENEELELADAGQEGQAAQQ